MTPGRKLSNRQKKVKMPRVNKSNFGMEKILGKPLEQVDDIIKNKEKHINRIVIPKKDGSPRNVIAPGKDLKYVQKSLYWRFFRRYKPHDAAHGFVPKRGISTNADFHVGAMSVGKIDVSNFFDSISTKHLQNCLFGNKHICRYCRHYERMMDGLCNPSLYKNKEQNFKYKCEELKAVFIPDYCEKVGYNSLFNRVIELCTYEGFTAQGFPTSPVIANMVLRGFDQTMDAHCFDNNITYTRYADDLAFSSKTHTKEELKKAVMQKAYRHLFAYGFKANKKKTVFKSKSGRLKICGVVVNEKKNVQRSVVHKFRAKVHHATVKFPERTTKTRIRQLKGWASFLMSINHDKGKMYMDKLLAFEAQKFKAA